MITNSTPIGSGPLPGPDPRRLRPAGGPPPASVPTDRVNTSRADQLRSAMAASPAVRPEEVNRAEALAVDPNYPPLEIIERVARQIAASQDLSEIPD